MKKFLILISIIGIIVVSGSVFYYYIIFLPGQATKSQEDISAIRNVIAPTPAQEQLNEEAQEEQANNYENTI